MRLIWLVYGSHWRPSISGSAAPAEHPAILPLYAAFRDDDFLCVLMPHQSRGSLADCISDLTTDEGILASRVILPVVSAVAYLHLRGVLHRDIKLENVLADDAGTVHLTDLGFAIAVGHRTRALTQLGTLMAMAPEVILNDPTDPHGSLRHEVPRNDRKEYSAGADVWALGVLTWELLTGTRECRSTAAWVLLPG